MQLSLTNGQCDGFPTKIDCGTKSGSRTKTPTLRRLLACFPMLESKRCKFYMFACCHFGSSIDAAGACGNDRHRSQIVASASAEACWSSACFEPCCSEDVFSTSCLFWGQCEQWICEGRTRSCECWQCLGGSRRRVIDTKHAPVASEIHQSWCCP